jgi:SAM-dependent methyltransferase
MSFILPRISFEGRLIEYDFAHSYIDTSSKKIILDIGSADTNFPLELANKGHEVYSLDIIQRDYNEKIKFVSGTVENLPFKNNFFDVITAISTIEHIGLGRYGDPISPDGDINALREIERVLKPGGKLIFTIPAGIDTICYSEQKVPLHRVYSSQKLNKMFSHFLFFEISYVIKKNGIWRPGTESDAARIAMQVSPEKVGMTTIALITCIKEKTS